MKNNKILLIAGGVLILAIVGFVAVRSMGGSVPGMSNSPADSMENIFASGSVKCEYTDEEGRTVISYIKDEKIRSDYTGGPEGSGGMISKDNSLWTWDNTTKQGVLMKYEPVDVTETPESEEPMDDTDPQMSKEEIEQEMQQYKDSCKKENFSDSVFDAPTEITFQDMSDFMNQGGTTPMDPNQIPEEYRQYLPQE